VDDIIKFRDKRGKSNRGIKMNCAYCNKEFIRLLSCPTRLYCGPRCTVHSRSEKVKLVCGYCKKEFERWKGKVKQSKSGLSFCNRKCMDMARRVESNTALYKGGHSVYKRIAFSNQDPECVDCGIDFLPILVVHHIDRDRKNSSLDNLEIVCRNHHSLRHMKLKSGTWIRSQNKLTPRHLLKEVRELVEKSAK
jgi:hypothetical protein